MTDIWQLRMAGASIIVSASISVGGWKVIT
jgi:hypothetical protein